MIGTDKFEISTDIFLQIHYVGRFNGFLLREFLYLGRLAKQHIVILLDTKNEGVRFISTRYIMVVMTLYIKALLNALFFFPVVPPAQGLQVQMGHQVQGMVGMEDAEGIKHVLEWRTVTCTNLNTLGVEVVVQGDWAEV